MGGGFSKDQYGNKFKNLSGKKFIDPHSLDIISRDAPRMPSSSTFERLKQLEEQPSSRLDILEATVGVTLERFLDPNRPRNAFFDTNAFYISSSPAPDISSGLLDQLEDMQIGFIK